MLVALILVCSLVDVPDTQDCTRETAVTVIRSSEEYNTPQACFAGAFALAASLQALLDGETYARVACARAKGEPA